MNLHGTVVFCDDIRFEANGKVICVGAYADELMPAYLPQTLSMAFWVRLFGVPLGEKKLNLSIGANSLVQQTVEITINVDLPNRPTNLYFSGVPLNLDASGSIFLRLAELDGSPFFEDILLVGDTPPPQV